MITNGNVISKLLIASYTFVHVLPSPQTSPGYSKDPLSAWKVSQVDHIFVLILLKRQKFYGFYSVAILFYLLFDLGIPGRHHTLYWMVIYSFSPFPLMGFYASWVEFCCRMRLGRIGRVWSTRNWKPFRGGGYIQWDSCQWSSHWRRYFLVMRKTSQRLKAVASK